MSERLKTLACAVLVGILACIHFVADRGRPNLPFWDENYYVTAAQRYLDGTAQFAAHPPLGLMLIAAGEALMQENQGLNLSMAAAQKHVRGEQLPFGFSLQGLRLGPSLFAAGGALLFFGLMFSLTGERITALAFSCLYLHENAFMVHLPAVHLDAFQLFFVLGALWCLVAAIRQDRPPRRRLALLFGLCVGWASMVKANAVLLLAGGLWLLWRERCSTANSSRQRAARATAHIVLCMVLGFGLSVASVMTVHTALSRHMPDAGTEAGRQDLPFISERYRDYLQDGKVLTPLLVADVSSSYLRFMTADLRGVPKGSRSDSIPLLWPVHDGALNYRWDSNGQETRYVQLVGNLVNWGTGLGALLVCGAWVLSRRLLRAPGRVPSADQATVEMLLLIYVFYMAAHVWLGTQRIMYLYHYFIPLLLTYLMVPLCWRMLADARQWTPRFRHSAVLTYVCATLATCAFFWPLTRHEPLSREACEARNIIVQVVQCQP